MYMFSAMAIFIFFFNQVMQYTVLNNSCLNTVLIVNASSAYKLSTDYSNHFQKHIAYV